MQGFTYEEVFNTQRTPKGMRYEKFVTNLKSLSQEKKDRAGAPLWHSKAVSPGAVHTNTLLSNLSVMYTNDEYIGEQLIPAVSVGKRSDVFAIYPKRERFAYPDDMIGSRSAPNELNASRTTDNYSVKDYGFMDFVSQDTIDNQDAVFDEMLDLIENINEGIAFKREKRLATILTTTTNFGSNTATLSGSDQWDHASGGDPIKKIQDGKAALWNGSGPSDIVGYTSLEVLNVLARHPAIRDLFKYTGPEGLATADQIARYFGLSKLLVASSREDTANEGQTASYSRIWGKHFGMVRVARRPSKRMAAFAANFRMNGDPVTTQWFDQKPGKQGGFYGKVGVSEDAKIIAADTGYLYASVVS